VSGHGPIAEALGAARGADGGFGPRAGIAAEPEPTALAAIALDDQAARAWLVEHQAPDGSFSRQLGGVRNDAATALAALALEGEPSSRALDALERERAGSFASSEVAPFDASYRGWPWTEDAFGWIEPTARAVMALRVLRPAAAEPIADGLGVLRDRECVGGGWNYGNRIVLDEELPPFAQTTAIAMLALQGIAEPLVPRGLETLRRLWREEADGALSLSLATAALALHEDPDHRDAAAALRGNFERTGFLGDVVALAWAAIALGPGLDRIAVTR
jgi:hypothetical protein